MPYQTSQIFKLTIACQVTVVVGLLQIIQTAQEAANGLQQLAHSTCFVVVVHGAEGRAGANSPSPISVTVTQL